MLTCWSGRTLCFLCQAYPFELGRRGDLQCWVLPCIYQRYLNRMALRIPLRAFRYHHLGDWTTWTRSSWLRKGMQIFSSKIFPGNTFFHWWIWYPYYQLLSLVVAEELEHLAIFAPGCLLVWRTHYIFALLPRLHHYHTPYKYTLYGHSSFEG